MFMGEKKGVTTLVGFNGCTAQFQMIFLSLNKASSPSAWCLKINKSKYTKLTEKREWFFKRQSIK